MLYQIRKNADKSYTLQLGGTVRQIERLAEYFNQSLPYPGMRHLYLHTKTKKHAKQIINDIPANLAKVKRNISYIYEVNYYGGVDKEQFADCRYDEILKILSKETDEIVNLAQTYSSKPIVPKLIENKMWQGGDYQRKVWRIGQDKQIEFKKKPNDYFVFVKNRHHYFNVFR